MISPEAQLEKQNSEIWGDPSVLSFEKLNKNLKKDFENLLSKSTDLSFQDLDKKFLNLTLVGSKLLKKVGLQDMEQLIERKKILLFLLFLLILGIYLFQ